MGVLDDYERPGGAAADRFEDAKLKNPEAPHTVHVVVDETTGTPVEVWLNTEVSDFDGVCIGSGEHCVGDAVRTLEHAIEVLQSPPTPRVYRAADRL